MSYIHVCVHELVYIVSMVMVVLSFIVRKAAILNSTPLPPARQRRGFYSRNGPSSSSTDHHPGSNLMKQTMKMAKNRLII